MEQHLSIWDLVLTPLYLVGLIFIAKRIRNKHYPEGHPLRNYYLPGLYAKFGGAIFIALVYQYHYGSGDTFNYFAHSQIINSSLSNSLETWVKLLLRVSPDTDPYLYRYSSQLYWYNNPSSYAVPAIAAVFGVFNGTSYIPIALLFAFFSYSGLWAMYRTFVQIYPALHKQLAIAFLFVPSVIVWGSAVFKDTVCMFGLGWMTYTAFRIFVNKDFSVKNLFMFALSFYLIALIKVYILIAFLPALMIWLLRTFSSRIRYVAARWTINAVFISLSLVGLFFASQKFAKELGEYSLDNLAITAMVTQDYINKVSEAEGGSSYDLGLSDPTALSIATKFPQAVVVTLFRPFLWEVKKPIMALSALESFMFLGFLLYVFYKKGLGATLKRVFSDPNLMFFLVFSLIFAFAVGISSGNFGALSRYKIPCMPFFAAMLIVLYYADSLQESPPKFSLKNNSMNGGEGRLKHIS